MDCMGEDGINPEEMLKFIPGFGYDVLGKETLDEDQVCWEDHAFSSGHVDLDMLLKRKVKRTNRQ